MMQNDPAPTSPATSLCLACGLCCNGHLFTWVKLRPAELDPAERLGLPVLRSDPAQRGFNQPCPLWQGKCTIYSNSHYPHACRAYKCRPLKMLINGETSLQEALGVIAQARENIQSIDGLLDKSIHPNFRERLVTRFESLQKSGPGNEADRVFQQKARALILYFDHTFGVNDLLETPLE